MIKKWVRTTLRTILSPLAMSLVGELLFRSMGRRLREAPESGDVKSILIVRLDQIGDLVLTTPFIKSLRRSFPGAWITLVVKPNVVGIVDGCPYVDEILSVPGQRPAPLAQIRRQWGLLLFAVKFLWKRNFHVAILPRWDVDPEGAVFLAYFSGARRRIGFSDRGRPKNPAFAGSLDRLLTDPVESTMKVHESERPLALLRVMGVNPLTESTELWITPKLRAYASDRTADLARPLISIAPSGGLSPLKQWPGCNYVELATRLIAKSGGHVLILGGQETDDLGAEIAVELRGCATNLCGRTSLDQLAALVGTSDLFIGNDSGPTHIAAAAGIPTVGLFGASCPHRFAPKGKQVEVIWNELPCSPCNRLAHQDQCPTCLYQSPLCMETLEVERVYTTAIGLLQATKRNVITHSIPD